MKLPRGFHWRIVLAFAALTAIALAVAGAALLDITRDAALTPAVREARAAAVLLPAAAAILALTLAMAVALALTTSRSIGSVARSARRIADGDLTHRAASADSNETRELADALNLMASTLRGIIGDLAGERDTIAAVLDTMGDGVLVAAANRRITLINRAALTLLNLRGDDVERRDFAELLRDPDLHGIVTRCQQSGERQISEMSLHQAGQLIPVSIIATPLPGGPPPDVLLTIHDLRALHQIETARREFVSNASHELRNPLTSIRLMTETLEGGALEQPEAARNFLLRIRREVDRMTALVEDFLELARLEGGRESVQPTALRLPPTLQEAVDRASADAALRGVSLTLDAPDGLPPVSSRENHVGQVLTNLLDNALKWTQAGGAVRVTASETPDGVRVTVEDTGAGIAPEHLPHIFERFYKADRSRTDGGSGLGLAIVKHIVESYGGAVEVQSRQGRGATFAFTLPRAP